jgi:hypothetical protein
VLLKNGRQPSDELAEELELAAAEREEEAEEEEEELSAALKT